MAIFPYLRIEKDVQTDDKTRLDCTRSFVSKDEAAITKVEIEPEAGSGFVDVTGSSQKDWYLDWSYSGASRTVTVSCRITTDGAPITNTDTIEVMTPADDNLFSGDQDLVALEHDVLRYVPAGRNSFLNVHRKAQYLILERFNDMGIRDINGDRITKEIALEVEEVRKWSQYLVLWLIFMDLSNAIGDVFDEKSKTYDQLAARASDKSFGKFLDLDKSGDVTDGEIVDVTTMDLLRR